ncbi:hypothetical protein RRG08_018809 [Elysia crispata]|uniref:Uncharacterized protein n=1 Tax=Elysia crispata TaxID=231223 RepID=A0AAE0ZSK0_9GAST|nr:hypothetical protein RRG08_018809 [Elysia crispata]
MEPWLSRLERKIPIHLGSNAGSFAYKEFRVASLYLLVARVLAGNLIPCEPQYFYRLLTLLSCLEQTPGGQKEVRGGGKWEPLPNVKEIGLDCV